MKHYSVIIFPRAQADLLEIRSYLEEVLSIPANTFLGKLSSHIPLLEENPFIHALILDPILNEKGYRFFQIDNYLAFYKVIERTVQIHRVLYGGRDYSKIL
ncbi:MAG: type II toxin-antitoxin system RelE/ParE family toxin [Spirochaetales bacterium]|nr:type II toxin-antitoxin system RelE/ParE family toxin [Spirochaetales bacterium]